MRPLGQSLIDGSALLEQGKRYVGVHVGRAIAALTLVLAAILTYAEVTVISDLTQRVVSEIVVLGVAAVLMYLAMQTEGEALGRQGERHQSLERAYREATAKIRGNRVLALSDYLDRYIADDLSRRRVRLLGAEGIDLSCYERYRIEGCDDRARRSILRRADRLRPIRMTARELLAGTEERVDALSSPLRRRGLVTLARLLPSLLSMLVTVSVIIEWRDPITLSTLAEGTVKLCALLSVGLKGYLDGYRYVTVSEAAHLGARLRILDAFLLECGDDGVPMP